MWQWWQRQSHGHGSSDIGGGAVGCLVRGRRDASVEDDDAADIVRGFLYKFVLDKCLVLVCPNCQVFRFVGTNGNGESLESKSRQEIVAQQM